MRHLRTSLTIVAAFAAWPALGQEDQAFLRGDTNFDGHVNISDPIALLGHLFSGSGPLYCAAAADSNDDGLVDVSDAIFTLDYLFRGGNSLPPPYPECGPDPMPDGLACSFSCSGECCPIPVPYREEDANTVRAIVRRNGRIEIEFSSRRPFPARALFPILCIGDTEFTQSGYGEDGSLNVVVFFLTDEEFEETESGAASIYYSCREEERDRWLFLDYDKGLLQ